MKEGFLNATFSSPESTPSDHQYSSKDSLPISIYRQKADLEVEIFRVVSEMWHPNIDKDGKVCISILHEPGWYS